MKKHLLLIAAGLCLLFVPGQLCAQIKLGAIGGVNFNDVTGDDDEFSDGMAVGYHLGGFINIGNKLMIEPQVLYCRKGTKLKSGNLNLDYLEIPIWLRYQLDGGLNFNVGPFIAVLLGAKADGEDSKDSYKTSDWGLGAGIGYQLEGGLGFAINYNQGISSIGEDFEIAGQSYSFDVKTTNIKISASYTFGGRRD